MSAPHVDLARIEPSDAQLAALASHRPDGPIVRERAAYPPGTRDGDVTGREAYRRYGVVAFQAILSTGGRILWATEGRNVAIGGGDELFHEVVAVWYPSRAAFLTLDRYPGYREAFELHRRASLERAVLLMCDGDAEPKLSTPYG